MLAGRLIGLAARPQLIYEFSPKVEEWVEQEGKVRAHMAHEEHLPLDYSGSEPDPRRWSRRSKSLPAAVQSCGCIDLGDWTGTLLRSNYGDGPAIDVAKSVLFVAWLARSRFPRHRWFQIKVRRQVLDQAGRANPNPTRYFFDTGMNDLS